MTNKAVLVGTQNNVGVVTLNAPEKRNAITLAIADALAAAIDTLEKDTNVRAIVITGAGTAFSAGGDLADLTAARDGDAGRLKRIYEGFLRVARCKLPTIAAVNGPAVGAGLNLALACDVRLASRTARFETRFAKIGLHPGGGHTWMLSRAVAPSDAAALLLFGEVMDGEAAARARLVSACVDDALLEALAWAGRLAALDRDLLIKTKDSLRQASAGDATHLGVMEREFARQAESLRSDAFAKIAAAAVKKA